MRFQDVDPPEADAVVASTAVAPTKAVVSAAVNAVQTAASSVATAVTDNTVANRAGVLANVQSVGNNVLTTIRNSTAHLTQWRLSGMKATEEGAPSVDAESTASNTETVFSSLWPWAIAILTLMMIVYLIWRFLRPPSYLVIKSRCLECPECKAGTCGNHVCLKHAACSIEYYRLHPKSQKVL